MSKHLKRMAAPRAWLIPKKTSHWVVKPSPGPHAIERCVPLLVAIRDLLHICDTGTEARRMVGQRKVMVDGKTVTDAKRPLGFMDVLSFPAVNEHYRVLLDRRRKVRLVKTTPDRAKWKLVRILDKTVTRGGKVQINLHDGRNLLLGRNDFSTGDTLKIELPTQRILTTYRLADGVLALLTGGNHAGELGTVERVEVVRSSSPNIVHFREGYFTVKDYVFPVGTGQPDVGPVEEVVTQ